MIHRVLVEQEILNSLGMQTRHWQERFELDVHAINGEPVSIGQLIMIYALFTDSHFELVLEICHLSAQRRIGVG